MTLYELRRSRGMTVKSISKTMDISASYYSHLETGRRRFTKALVTKCANALGVRESIITDKVRKIKDNSLLSRSWIADIRIKEENVLAAFEDDLRYEPVESKDELVNRFASFTRAHIAQEIASEFNNDAELLNLFAERFKVE